MPGCLDAWMPDTGCRRYWILEILDTGDLDTKDTGCCICRMLEIPGVGDTGCRRCVPLYHSVLPFSFVDTLFVDTLCRYSFRFTL